VENLAKQFEAFDGIDPVCGMEVSEQSEYQFQFEGKRYNFCSQHCEEKFAADPSHFVNGAGMNEETGHDHEHGGSCHAGHHDHAVKVDVVASADGTVFTCPMHPEIQEKSAGPCPKCGMALEPVGEPTAPTRTEYTCPMHPEIVQDEPGSCPKCGMALESRRVEIEEKNEELIDMSRRFRVSAILALPVFLLAMVADLMPGWLPEGLSLQMVQWIEFTLATPVVFWGGWPFFVRGWQSVVTWNLNMFTLIGLGVAVAWAYSVVAMLFPGIFPSSMLHQGTIPVYFEAAAVITALVLLGQVLEMVRPSEKSCYIRRQRVKHDGKLASTRIGLHIV